MPDLDPLRTFDEARYRWSKAVMTMDDAQIEMPPCCFCGQTDFIYPDPTMLNVSTTGEITRVWNCHVEWFEERAVGIAAPWLIHDAGWPQK